MRLQNERCIVEILEDTASDTAYDIELDLGNFKRDELCKTLSIIIDLFDKQIRIALAGDPYSMATECAVLEDTVLTVLQNDCLTQLNVLDGSVLRFIELNSFGCNFGIYKVSQGYVLHGEIEIVMLDADFNRKWTFSGRDIFATISGNPAFQLSENSIRLYDFNDNFYEIDFDGKLIREIECRR